MINGMNITQIQQVRVARHWHQRRLTEIETQGHSRISLLDRSLITTIKIKKQNHQKWKHFKREKQKQEERKDNKDYFQKLQKIKTNKSPYNDQRHISFSNSKAHNFYIRKNKLKTITTQNFSIAKRIINAQSSFSSSKGSFNYSQMQKVRSRLQKFPVFVRLSEFSNKKKLGDTGGCMLQQEGQKFKSKRQYIFNNRKLKI